MASWDGSSLLQLALYVGVPLFYLYYFWTAKDEMKGKPKIKKMIWLVLVPILPGFLFIFPFYTMLVLILSIAIGEASECQ